MIKYCEKFLFIGCRSRAFSEEYAYWMDVVEMSMQKWKNVRVMCLNFNSLYLLFSTFS